MPAEREQRGSAPAHATGAVQFVGVDDIAPDETFRLRPDGDVSELATALGRLGQLTPVELRPCPGAGDGARWQVVAGFRRLAAVRMLARDRVLARLHGELGDEDAWGLALGEALLHEPLTGEDLEALRERLRASGAAPWAEELVDDAIVRAPVAAELRERFYEFLRAGDGAAAAETSTAASLPTATPTASSTASSTSSGVTAGQPSLPRDPATGRDERGQSSTPPEPPPATSTPTATPADLLAQTATSIEPSEPAIESQPAEDFIEVTPDELVQDLVGRLAALNQDLATAVEAWKDLPPEGRKALLDQARYVAALLPFMETQE